MGMYFGTTRTAWNEKRIDKLIKWLVDLGGWTTQGTASLGSFFILALGQVPQSTVILAIFVLLAILLFSGFLKYLFGEKSEKELEFS